MRWRRRHTNGELEAASRDADEQLRSAEAMTREVDRTARAASELVRRTDWFAAEVQRTLRPPR